MGRLAETKKAAVELKVAGQDKAATLTQSAGTEKTAKEALGEDASVSKAPVTTVEVETTARVSKTRKDLTTAIHGAGTEIGGTISIDGDENSEKAGTPTSSLSGSVWSSLSGVLVAAFIILDAA